MIESEYLKNLVAKAKKLQKTIVLPEGEDERILKAAHIIAEEEAANLVILGDETEIKNYFAQNNWSMNRISIVAPETSPKLEEYANLLYELRKAKGMTPEDARKTARDANYFGTLMVKAGFQVPIIQPPIPFVRLCRLSSRPIRIAGCPPL